MGYGPHRQGTARDGHWCSGAEVEGIWSHSQSSVEEDMTEIKEPMDATTNIHRYFPNLSFELQDTTEVSTFRTMQM